MDFAKLLAGLVFLFNHIFKNQNENELRKEGARKADLAGRNKIDEVRDEAEKIRRNSIPGSKSDIIKRL